MKTKSKIPALRFKGFTDAWEQRKLEKHIIEYHEVTTENNQYPVLTSSRKGIFLQTDYYSGNQVASADNTGYNIVPYGYFTYRHMSDDEIFHFNINDIVENGIVSTLYPVFTTDEKLDSRYLQYQLNYGSEFARFAVLQKQGGSRTYMYLNKLKKLSLTMPTSIDEQKKISSFLMSLDNLITLHQRKCEQTKELKKTMLQKMFPKKGERIPEIRFPEFTDEWEEKKLGEVGETFTGLSGKTKADFGHGAGKFVTYVNVFNNPISDLKGVDSIEIDDNQKQVQYGDILITTSSETPEEVGMTSVWLGREENVYLNSFCFGFRPTTELSSYYMAYALRSHEVRKKFIILAQGISRYNISKTKVMEINIPFPSLPEQEAIGTYFQTLDQDIAQIEKKLADLKELKKTLLRQLFV